MDPEPPGIVPKRRICSDLTGCLGGGERIVAMRLTEEGMSEVTVHPIPGEVYLALFGQR